MSTRIECRALIDIEQSPNGPHEVYCREEVIPGMDWCGSCAAERIADGQRLEPSDPAGWRDLLAAVVEHYEQRIADVRRTADVGAEARLRRKEMPKVVKGVNPHALLEMD